jgi:putative redox protein
VINILKKQRVDPELFKITIKGRRKEGNPSPYEEFVLVYEVDDSIDKIKLAKNVKLVEEKYCSVSASLDEKIVIKHEII